MQLFVDANKMCLNMFNYCVIVSQVPLMNGQMGTSARPQMTQVPMARHPSREQLIDYLMLKVSQQPQGPTRGSHDAVQQEVKGKMFFFVISIQFNKDRTARISAVCVCCVGGWVIGFWDVKLVTYMQVKVCCCVSDPCKGGEESRTGFQYIRRSGRSRKPLSSR